MKDELEVNVENMEKKLENWCETNEQMSVQRKYLDMI
jgi:hypothetical protein